MAVLSVRSSILKARSAFCASKCFTSFARLLALHTMRYSSSSRQYTSTSSWQPPCSLHTSE